MSKGSKLVMTTRRYHWRCRTDETDTKYYHDWPARVTLCAVNLEFIYQLQQQTSDALITSSHAFRCIRFSLPAVTFAKFW